MKSQELHRHLQVALGGWFRAHGFVVARRTPLAWYRQPLLVWIQLHPHGWDPHSGSSFYVNFQTGSAQAWDGPMRRLQEFLTDEELEEMRALHNRVIPKLTLPPREHLQALTAFFTKGSPDAESIIDHQKDLRTVTPRLQHLAHEPTWSDNRHACLHAVV